VNAALALAASTIVAFFAGRWAGDTGTPHRGRVTALFTVTLLAAYLAFLKTAAVTALPRFGRIALPLGVSYYTFKLISYVLDVYWEKIEPARQLIPFAAYVSFFPQILAGPIQRPGDFLRQIPPPRAVFREGAWRIAWGLIKKLAVADQLAPTVNYVFSHMKGLHGAEVLAGFYLFPLQLYLDFSALTDIAIGVGRLFGIEGPENFNRPFTASTITEFWRRWHMSLTTWLADYVFTPLRMSTRKLGKVGLAFSITVNMVAIGLWHSFTWTFFAFGLLHAGYLTVETLTSRQRSRFLKQWPAVDQPAGWLGSLYVYHATAIAFLFFRAQSVSDAAWGLTHLLAGIGTLGADLAHLLGEVDARSLTVGLAGVALVELAERYRPDRWCARFGESLPLWAQASLRGAILVVLAVIIFQILPGFGSSERPFIYEGF
jgi:D-alanyl-lipoteichoic acid acyltransferase DltB (MBOAT superfamily)